MEGGSQVAHSTLLVMISVIRYTDSCSQLASPCSWTDSLSTYFELTEPTPRVKLSQLPVQIRLSHKINPPHSLSTTSQTLTKTYSRYTAVAFVPLRRQAAHSVISHDYKTKPSVQIPSVLHRMNCACMSISGTTVDKYNGATFVQFTKHTPSIHSCHTWYTFLDE